MERNSRACFYTSLFLIFAGFLVISAALSILISYTIEIPGSNETVSKNDSFFNKIRGNSPQQSLLIIFSSFLTFGLLVSIVGFLVLCCSVNCGSKIGIDDKDEYDE